MPGTEIVAVVAPEGLSIPGFDPASFAAPGSEPVFARVRERVSAQLAGQSPIGSFSCTVDGIAWGVLVEAIRVNNGTVRGALVVARQGRAWSNRERSLAKTLGGLLSHVATLATRESSLLHQQRLDELVSRVAERLMSTSSRNRKEVLDWTTRVLAEFLGADVAFLRRNDHARGLSILESEWPAREVDGVDPLGEVPFDADPVFAAMKDLREPYLPEDDTPDEYLERVEKGSGVKVVGGAAVPLLLGGPDLGDHRLLALRDARVDAVGGQRAPGGRLDARAAPGAPRRRGADRVQRVPRRPDRPREPPSAAARAEGPPRVAPHDRGARL